MRKSWQIIIFCTLLIPCITAYEARADYQVPDDIPVIAQDGDTCWAAATTMMFSWRDKSKYGIKQVADKLGKPFRELFDKKAALPSNMLESLVSSAGFKAEAGCCYPVEGLEQLLKKYGAVIFITREDPNGNRMLHARIVRGISGGPQFDKAMVDIVDSAGGGKSYKEKFSDFVRKYESVPSGPQKDWISQVLHF